MTQRSSLNRADVTPDARLIQLGREVSHQSDVPAYEFSMCAPLINGQRDLAQELHLGAGVLVPLTRSSIAQLGVELDVRKVTPVGSLVCIEGYVLSTNGNISNRVIDRVKEMMRQHMEVMLGRVGLLPSDSRVGLAKRLRRAVDRGRLMSESLQQMPDRSVLLEVGSTAYVLPEARATDALLDNILIGKTSGRKALDEARDQVVRPDMLEPGQFMVTDLDIGSQSHHVLLRPELVDASGHITSARHHLALFLDAGRTQKQKGKRHAELWNRGRGPVDLRSMYIQADLYRPTTIQDAGH